MAVIEPQILGPVLALRTGASIIACSAITPRGIGIGLNLTGVGADDPDAQFYENYACGSQLYENYACGSPRNYIGYCNPALQKLFDQQSIEADQEKRRRLV